MVSLKKNRSLVARGLVKQIEEEYNPRNYKDNIVLVSSTEEGTILATTIGLYLGKDIGINNNGDFYLFNQHELKSVSFQQLNNNHNCIISENLYSIPYAIHAADKFNLQYFHKTNLENSNSFNIALQQNIKNHKENKIFYENINLEKLEDRNVILVELNNNNLNEKLREDLNLKTKVALYGNNEEFKKYTLINK